MVDPDMQALIFDTGHDLTKCGFSGDDAPRAVLPTIIGRPRNPDELPGMNAKDCFVGDEAQAKRKILKITHPLPVNRHGKINFDDVEKFFHHCFYNELCVTPEEHPVMITSLTENMKERDFEKITSIMFETFNVPAFYIIDQAVASLYASGRTTGQVLCIGGGSTVTVSIYEGYPMQHTKLVLEDIHGPARKRIAGELISDVFFDSLKRNKVLDPVNTLELPDQRNLVRDLKEKYMVLSVNKHEVENVKYFNRLREGRKKSREHRANQLARKCRDTRSYYYEYALREMKNFNQWSDVRGEVVEYETVMRNYNWERKEVAKVQLGEERFEVPELLFRPSIIGYSTLPGIHEMIKQSIEKCNKDLHEELYRNIVLAGGTSMIEYFPERLYLELAKTIPKRFVDILRVNAPAERKCSAWIGGSILSSLSTFQNMWITKDEYDDAGPRIARTKCLCTTIGNNEQKLRIGDILFDSDLEERRLYVVEECFNSLGERELSFKILCLDSCVLEIRFKSFLLF